MHGKRPDFAANFDGQCVHLLQTRVNRRVVGGGVPQRLEPQHERGEILAHLVVEFARDAAALLLLHGHQLPQQQLPGMLGPRALADLCPQCCVRCR